MVYTSVTVNEADVTGSARSSSACPYKALDPQPSENHSKKDR
jgi:hypothetical protein